MTRSVSRGITQAPRKGVSLAIFRDEMFSHEKSSYSSSSDLIIMLIDVNLF
jgi:hypothetical protein